MAGKKPLIAWSQWQTREQNREQFDSQPWQDADGFAIVCGTKNNEDLFIAAVDFDVKNVSEDAKEKGRQVLRYLLTTRIEETPSGGQHWIYLCRTKPRSISAYHNDCSLELIGEGKLCIMAPSQGYKQLNDNSPSTVADLETALFDAMNKAGFKTETTTTEAWFDRKDLSGKRFTGKTPPCIEALYRGAKEGERNEHAIRLASFLANFRKMRPPSVLEQMRKINKFFEPPLDDQELQGIVRSAVNGGYVYRCQDPFLKRNCCREDCPIAPANIAKMLSKEEIERAEKLLVEAELLDHALRYGRRRLLGEDAALQSNFVLFCSGRTRHPVSGMVSGFSGTGKNESIRAIKPLFPKEWYFEFTTSTPEAMKYLPEEFDGTLVIYEAVGVKGDSGSLSLRAIGEGESIETIYPMRNEITGKMEMGRAKTNAKNFITTSSDIDINPDLYRRVLKHTMNHSTQLTKRVVAKKVRDALYPDALKEVLHLEKDLAFTEQDFQNALRLLDWKLEAIVITPPEFTRILDLAVKREQEVALRTHVEKIINFTKTIALLNQRQRMRIQVDSLEVVIAEPSDFLRALEILSASIMETVSRIEKRQEEALRLFTSADVSLNKNDVASQLKVSSKTASRMLKTLAQAGYLKEETQGRTYQYGLLQTEPKHLDLVENITSFKLFHRKELRNWLNSIWTTGHANGTPIRLKQSGGKTVALNSERISRLMNEESPSAPLGTSTCPDVQLPSEPELTLNSQNSLNNLDKTERSTSALLKHENSRETGFLSLDKLVSVHWADHGHGWHDCGVCGHEKLTSCQAKTFSGNNVWICEDCYGEWEKRRAIN